LAVDFSFLLPLLATSFGIYVILALSFNLEYGYAGQPNLGKVFFYSVGAYVGGAITTHALWALMGAPADVPFMQGQAAALRQAFARANPGAILGLFVVSLVAAALIGAAVGYLAAYPALRLRGDFLAIVLIAVGEAGRVFGRNYEPLAGGVFGLPGVPNPFAWLPPRVDSGVYAILVLAIAAFMYLFARRLSNSPFGRLLKSVRDDELAASVYGKDAPRVKGYVLAIGSGMAGVAGALYVFYVQQVYADDFIPLISFAAVTMVMLGGVANHRGAIVGAAFMTMVDFMTRPVFLAILGINWQPPFDLNYVRYLVTGVIIIVVLLFRPKGLIPERPVETVALRIAKTWKPPATGDETPRGGS
jgi:branched-chain amino acid transport system permease protein